MAPGSESTARQCAAMATRTAARGIAPGARRAARLTLRSTRDAVTIPAGMLPNIVMTSPMPNGSGASELAYISHRGTANHEATITNTSSASVVLPDPAGGLRYGIECGCRVLVECQSKAPSRPAPRSSIASVSVRECPSLTKAQGWTGSRGVSADRCNRQARGARCGEKRPIPCDESKLSSSNRGRSCSQCNGLPQPGAPVSARNSDADGSR
jgi:hypothetical protein